MTTRRRGGGGGKGALSPVSEEAAAAAAAAAAAMAVEAVLLLLVEVEVVGGGRAFLESGKGSAEVVDPIDDDGEEEENVGCGLLGFPPKLWPFAIEEAGTDGLLDARARDRSIVE